MAKTTNYNLEKPVNQSSGWGDDVNGNFDTIDTLIKQLAEALIGKAPSEHGHSTTAIISALANSLSSGDFEGLLLKILGSSTDSAPKSLADLKNHIAGTADKHGADKIDYNDGVRILTVQAALRALEEDGSVTLAKLAQDVLDYINANGGDSLYSMVNQDDVVEGSYIDSRSGNLGVRQNSRYILKVPVYGLSEIYYTGNSISIDGLAFFDINGDYISGMGELGECIDYKITVPDGTYYVSAGSRESDIDVDIKISPSQLTELVASKIGDINALVSLSQTDIEKLYSLLISMNFLTITKTGSAENTGIPLGQNYLLTTVGDYIEIDGYGALTNTGYDMFTGANSITKFGLYNDGRILFKSGGSSVITWYSGLEINQMRNMKLLYNSNSKWELFIDGVSKGEKTITPNATISLLSSSTDDSTSYTYKSVKIHSAASGDITLNALDIALLTDDGVLGVEQTDSVAPEVDYSIVDGKIDDKLIPLTPAVYYSRINEDYPVSQSSLVFEEPQSLSVLGDYFEFMGRCYANPWTSYNSLSIFEGTLRLGFNGYQFILRGLVGGSNITLSWSMEEKPWKWNKIKYEVVQADPENNPSLLGYELFVNDISKGIKSFESTNGVIDNATINEISSVIWGGSDVAKYDFYDLEFGNSTGISLSIPQPALYSSAGNIKLRKVLDEFRQKELPLCFVSYIKGNYGDTNVDEEDWHDGMIKVYTKHAEYDNRYLMFTISRLYSRNKSIDIDNVWYVHYWHLDTPTRVCTYDIDREIMYEEENFDMLIKEGESETVLQWADGADFTGGFHGDESIDVIDGDYMSFYIDGVLLELNSDYYDGIDGEDNDTQSFYLLPCKNASIKQRSTLHETVHAEPNVETDIIVPSGLTYDEPTKTLYLNGVLLPLIDILSIENNKFYIDGQDTGEYAYNRGGYYSSIEAAISEGVNIIPNTITGKWKFEWIYKYDKEHTPRAKHFKETILTRRGYQTKNRYEFLVNNPIFIWYIGLICLCKHCARVGHSDDYINAEFVEGAGDFTVKISGDGRSYKSFSAYNPYTGFSTYVEALLTDNGGIIDENDTYVSVLDRGDTKFYRGVRNISPEVGTSLSSIMTVNFGLGPSTQ